MGRDYTTRWVVDLINKMTGSTSNGIGETPVSATSAHDEDLGDDDGVAEEDD